MILFVFTLGDDSDILFMSNAKCHCSIMPDMINLKYRKYTKI